jgi:putative transposase
MWCSYRNAGGRTYGAGSRAYAHQNTARIVGSGYIKGKSAIAVARQFGGRKRNFNGEKLWARGYSVSTVGFEEEQVRKYICHQEQLDTKGYDAEEKEKDDVTGKDDGKF